MPVNMQTVEGVASQVGAATGIYNAAQTRPEIGDDVKLLAAAIVMAGGQIALAIYSTKG